jgi:uncharacterized lipoprotein YajG
MITRGLLLLTLAGPLLGGCAFTTSTLNVRYDEVKSSPGPLSSAEPRRIEITAVNDKRPDTARIGYKKNGFNQKTADIKTARPVPDIVRDALGTELKKNGHLLGTGDGQLRLAADVDEFWFDLQIGFWTLQFLGTTGMTLTVMDGRTGATLHIQRYQGSHKDSRAMAYEGTWEEVMNAALEQMMRDVATDPKLVEVFKRR